MVVNGLKEKLNVIKDFKCHEQRKNILKWHFKSRFASVANNNRLHNWGLPITNRPLGILLAGYSPKAVIWAFFSNNIKDEYLKARYFGALVI